MQQLGAGAAAFVPPLVEVGPELVQDGVADAASSQVGAESAGPLSAGGGVLVCADDSGVDLDQPIDVTGRIGLDLDLLEGVGEDALQGGSAEAGVDRFPRP
ncbi:hypothetical protein [Streptomyces sp. NPDC002205]|uniref:hypothetical protein n=1 Tax=Streptomyces sp. NPDC002205 TaxID=3154411 RepID=UPI003319C098